MSNTLIHSNIAADLLKAGLSTSPAIIFQGQTTTYGDLRSDVLRTVGLLVSTGIKSGDFVGLLSENSPFFIQSYLAVIFLGATVVPFQVEVAGSVFDEIVRVTHMKALFVSKKYEEKITEFPSAALLQLFVQNRLDLDSEVPDIPPQNVDIRKHLAVVNFTSGSTGKTKGVMVSHRNIECNTLDIVNYLSLSQNDRVMVVLPFHYCYGASLMHTHLAVGATIVINNQFMFPEKVLDDMLVNSCTGFAGVPSTYQILLRKTRFRSMKFPALRWFQQAGGKLPNPFISEILESFPSTRYFLMYGQTEATARLSYLPPEHLQIKLGSIGRGLPSTRLEVLKEDGTPVAPDNSEVGEIVATGDNITLGYLNDPDETAKYFRDGSLRTGDMARVDSDGYIYIIDRERDFIKSYGNRVSSKEIEDVIAELPQVVEVAVIGLQHEIQGEAIKAFVVPVRPQEGLERLITQHCLTRLPNSKVPELIEIVRSLPKNDSGKVMKSMLREAKVSL